MNQLLSSHHVTVAAAHVFSVPGESIQATRPDTKILSDFAHPVFCLSYGPYHHWFKDPLISNEFNLTAAFCRQSNAFLLQAEIGDMDGHVGNLAEAEVEVGCLRSSASDRDPCLKEWVWVWGLQGKKMKINNKLLSYCRKVWTLGRLWSNLLLKSRVSPGFRPGCSSKWVLKKSLKPFCILLPSTSPVSPHKYNQREDWIEGSAFSAEASEF